MSEETDARMDQLVAAATTRDPKAVEELLRIVRPLVVRYCRTRLGGYERANSSPDDVAQEVCLAVLRALPTYRDQGRPFLAFVYGIAQHKVVDAHRSSGRDRSDPTDEPPEEADERDSPEQHAVNFSESQVMRELLDRVPEKQREVLVMRVVVGLSAEETADAVGSTAGAVRVAQHRALGKLRQLLAEEAGVGAAGQAGPVAGGRHAGRPSPRTGSAGGTRPGAPAAPGRSGLAPGAPTNRPAPGGRPPARGVRPTGPGRPTPGTDAPGRALPGPPVLDWDAAPRTGDIALDRLLDLADDHVSRVAGAGASAPTGPVGVPVDSPRARALAKEDARMERAAREFRERHPPPGPS